MVSLQPDAHTLLMVYKIYFGDFFNLKAGPNFNERLGDTLSIDHLKRTQTSRFEP